MRIESIRLQNVGVHDDRTLTLPEKGAVLVTGRNGSGKSSFIEGAALGLWGESLRGEALWREGQQGIVTVEVAIGQTKLIVLRKRTKAGAKSLSWWWSGEEPTKYETPSKAQEALEEIVGTFDTWRRTCVLSSTDSAHFSLATDAERKRLLERLLGIDKLDAAADAARADLRKHESQLALAQQDSRNLAGHLATAKARVSEVSDSLSALGATSGTQNGVAGVAGVDGAALRRALKVAEEEQGDVSADMLVLRDAVAEARASAEESRRRMERLAADNCPTCAQAIPGALRSRLEREAAHAQSKLEAASGKLRERQTLLNASLGELNSEINRLRDALAKAGAEERANAQNAKLRATLDKQLAEATAAVEKATTDAKAASEKVEKIAGAVVEQKAVSEVFGFKGVRAHLLDKALRQVERVANRHLSTLAKGMKVTLASTTEKKTGGLSEAISLRVSIGAAPARPYASLSGGERRRVDVAVLLALADVAAGASGRRGGTLWMDEVFDALDGDGAAAVGTVVENLSTTRAVVLVTHADSLVRSIQTPHRLSL